MTDGVGRETELKESIRVLMAENELLAEHAEATLLLGLIGERMATAESRRDALETALEQVVAVKGLDLAVCLTLTDTEATVEGISAVRGSGFEPGNRIPIPPPVRQMLESGAILLSVPALHDSLLPALDMFLQEDSSSVLLISRTSYAGDRTCFLFVDDQPEQRLRALVPLLNRIVDMVMVRRDNLYLMQELKDLNAHLDHLVEVRTVELQRMNEALTAEIARRAASEEALRLSLDEKTILLREIHHRVKNNLQVISSMLSLQMLSVEDPVAREQLRETRGRILSMARIHEKLYQSGTLVNVDFGEYVRGIAGELLQSLGHGGIVSRIHVEDLHLELDVAIPCCLIINELVTNALRHAFDGRKDGTIDIDVVRQGNTHICITVADDGVGLPGGVEISTAQSLGLLIVRTLVTQLSGDVGIERNVGTRFVIRVPLRG